MMFKCPNCGKMINSGNIICPFCRGEDRYDRYIDSSAVRIKCQSCGKKISSLNKNCPYCQSENSLSDNDITALSAARKKRCVITIISSIAAFVLLIIVLNANLMLFPHQYQARINTKAIKAYAKEHYPNAVLVEKHYYTIENFKLAAMPTTDVFVYELDGLRFHITAREGKCDSNNDGYGYALLDREIREKYLNDFFIKRGIPYDPDITLSYANTGIYGLPGKDATLADFPGSIYLDFLLEYENDKPTPRDFEWFYEFYLYWKEVCPTEGFSIRFCYRINRNSYYTLYCYSNSQFENEDDFYNSFEYLD